MVGFLCLFLGRMPSAPFHWGCEGSQAVSDLERMEDPAVLAEDRPWSKKEKELYMFQWWLRKAFILQPWHPWVGEPAFHSPGPAGLWAFHSKLGDAAPLPGAHVHVHVWMHVICLPGPWKGCPVSQGTKPGPVPASEERYTSAASAEGWFLLSRF